MIKKFGEYLVLIIRYTVEYKNTPKYYYCRPRLVFNRRFHQIMTALTSAQMKKFTIGIYVRSHSTPVIMA